MTDKEYNPLEEYTSKLEDTRKKLGFFSRLEKACAIGFVLGSALFVSGAGKEDLRLVLPGTVLVVSGGIGKIYSSGKRKDYEIKEEREENLRDFIQRKQDQRKRAKEYKLAEYKDPAGLKDNFNTYLVNKYSSSIPIVKDDRLAFKPQHDPPQEDEAKTNDTKENYTKTNDILPKIKYEYKPRK